MSESAYDAVFGSAWHVDGKDIKDNMSYSTSAASPVGVVTPTFIGKWHFDTAGQDFYMSTGLTNTDWTLVTTSPFFLKAQAVPAAKTVTAAITAAELIAGLITTTGVTAPSVHQLPTGALIEAALPGIATGDSFDFTLINTGTGASDDATITVNTGVTIVGNPTVGALTDATIISGSGTFRARRSAADTFVVYRLS
ncbi:hypothetical protein NKJ93_02325 [Mesorhizobium sp. M0028]|uniref:hypothetical protein n=1 Tax=Mesorhizobium sp. M0028 TaxID=2956849 RepID=UPI00333BF7DB